MESRKYLVDVVITQTKTIQVLASNQGEATEAVQKCTVEDILTNPAVTKTTVRVLPPYDPSEFSL